MNKTYPRIKTKRSRHQGGCAWFAYIEAHPGDKAFTLIRYADTARDAVDAVRQAHQQWTGVSLPTDQRPTGQTPSHVVDELKAHLREAIRDIERGKPDTWALRQALVMLGEPAEDEE